MKFFTKVFGCPPRNKNAPISTPYTSHSNSKILEKLDKARVSALVS